MTKPLVAGLSTKIVPQDQGLRMLFNRAALPLSQQTLAFVSGLIRTHREQLGSVWRNLNSGQQALAVLVYLRKGGPFAEVGAGFDISTTACWHETGQHVITPYKGKSKPESRKDASRAPARKKAQWPDRSRFFRALP